jgi:hypothetical protein
MTRGFPCPPPSRRQKLLLQQNEFCFVALQPVGFRISIVV